MAEIGVIYRPTRHKGWQWIRRKVISRQIRKTQWGLVSTLTVRREDKPNKPTEWMAEAWFDAGHRQEDLIPEHALVADERPASLYAEPNLRTLRYCARCGEIAGSATGFTKECIGNLKPEHDVKTAEVQLPDPLFAPEFQR